MWYLVYGFGIAIFIILILKVLQAISLVILKIVNYFVLLVFAILNVRSVYCCIYEVCWNVFCCSMFREIIKLSKNGKCKIDRITINNKTVYDANFPLT